MNDTRLKLKVDVGPSSQWSEVQSIQSLDNLLNLKYIDLPEYLERIPDGLIPDKQKLIDARKQQVQNQQNSSFEAFISKLSPELQAAIQKESQAMTGGAPNGGQQMPTVQQ